MKIITERVVDNIYSVVDFKMMELVETMKSWSPYRKNWIISGLVISKMLGLIFFNFAQDGRSFVRVIGTCKEKIKSIFNFFSATAKCWKWRWLSQNRILVSSFILVGLWQPKILFAVGLMNFKIFALKMLSVSEFTMFKSNLFYSIMVNENFESWKKTDAPHRHDGYWDR